MTRRTAGGIKQLAPDDRGAAVKYHRYYCVVSERRSDIALTDWWVWRG